ncbi:lycopene cyclase family protein [Streptomyces sp. NPDC058877]|uniref:lycopene cyclase family protein n=1 Tax=Streptomyces sp. NPDC058877 TaxID=3346665 RepID=UPI0036AE6E09
MVSRSTGNAVTADPRTREESGPVQCDVVVIGAGAAGLSLAWRLLAPPAGVAAPSVALVEAPPGPLRPPPRTWCYWERGAGDYDHWLTASWGRLRLHAPGGRALHRDLGGLRYKMLSSDAFDRGLRPRLTGLRRVEAVAREIVDRPDGVTVICRAADGTEHRIRARWAFDSRPPSPAPPARVGLLQHFKGWLVHTERAAFAPDAVHLMDFRTAQPPHGLSFGYVLPLTPHRALVEYTEFSAAPLSDDSYDEALRHYTGSLLGLRSFEVRAVEQGRIAMTDARHPRRAGRSTFRIGSAGGAVRPSTGYAFAAIQRQTKAVASLVHAGREPLPPPAYPRRSLAMDAILLRGIDTGRISGPDFFTRLFEEVPAERLLRFLDGGTGPLDEFRIGLHTPVLTMLRTTAELPFLGRRT